MKTESIEDYYCIRSSKVLLILILVLIFMLKNTDYLILNTHYSYHVNICGFTINYLFALKYTDKLIFY